MAAATEATATAEIKHTNCFIGGRWVPASDGKTFPTVNPATEEVIAEVAQGTAEDIDNAVYLVEIYSTKAAISSSVSSWVTCCISLLSRSRLRNCRIEVTI